MNPKHNELATGELSLEELDAVAAGNIFGDAWRWAKDQVNGKINEYKTYGRMMLDVGRSFIRLFC